MASGVVAICWGNFGPYHHARAVALQRCGREAGFTIIPVQVASASTVYGWKGIPERCEGLRTLCPGSEVSVSPLSVFFRALKLFRQEGVNVALVPAYSPPRFLAVSAAAKLLGIPAIMMNDSHGGTAQATGLAKWVKRMIVRSYDGALVAGNPQRRYFNLLGIPADRIFTGYDAVDNDFFASKSNGERVRRKEVPIAGAYALPDRYFLSLGRMVAKKNLTTLIAAYGRYARGARASGLVPLALVMVGSGAEEQSLKDQARRLGLRVVDRSGAPYRSFDDMAEISRQEPSSKSSTGAGEVFFYGFRQVEENPTFYAYAEAFVLPSLFDEWGLVVNEAMACSLPVIVSRGAGCAEDLLPERAPDGAGGGDLDWRSNGLVFDPRSAAELARALAAVADMAEGRIPNQLPRMGRSSREIVERFSCANFARQALASVRAVMAD